MSALRSTLPKESEREMVMAAEQQQLEQEEASTISKRELFPTGLF